MFPAYDPKFATYSPGLVLLAKVVEEAPLLGLHVIDLGKGAEGYKGRFANASIPLAEGSVEASDIIAASRRLMRLARSIRGKAAGAFAAR